jgi:inorganic pyrophosphatase
MTNSFKVLIEIPQGTINNKFEYDHKTGKMVLDFVFQNLVWPFNYGEIVGTLGGDGDALDAIVLSSTPIEQGKVVECKTIGVLKTLDRGAVDDKIVCVPIDDMLSQKYQDVDDLPPDTLQKWTKLYMEIARQKKKVIEILGLKNKQEAEQEIKNSLI